MKSFPAATMRALDRRTIDEYGIPGIVLMENAGTALTHEILRFVSGMRNPEFMILAGKGNNGGDALIAAGQLFSKQYPVTLFMAARPDELTGDAAEAFEELPQKLKEQIQFDFTADSIGENAVLVDGLLGTGIRGALREPFATWIRIINDSRNPVVSIDLPSGLNADDGSADCCVTADLTVTMAAVKTGMLVGKGPNASGRIVVARIGIPDRCLEEAGGDYELFTRQDARNLLRREPFNTYKNRRGHLGIVGGSSDYGSAPFLSAEAALRTGAGLVTVLIPASTEVLCNVRKALIVRRVEDRALGCFNSVSIPALEQQILPLRALAVGPGLTRREELRPVLECLIASGKPMVLDADALNILAETPALLMEKRDGILLTPHPGEMARLQTAFGLDGSKHRIEQALDLAYVTGAVVILKGSRSITASPEGDYCINMSGCAALATAGSGDTLTGICGALLAQGYCAWDAARLGAFLHGLCGELLLPYGSRGILADDLADVIPQALKRILPTA